MTYLTTGVMSGLGRYAHERLGGLGLSRDTPAERLADWSRRGVEVIVHCAASGGRTVPGPELFGFLDDNVLLTRRLTAVPHRKFIYISTVDVYPPGRDRWREDDVIDAGAIPTLYGLAKFMSESIVRHDCPNHLILRPSTLLGAHAKKSGATPRMLAEEGCRVSLSAQSSLNYVLHSDVVDFIEEAVRRDLRGIYNAVGGEPMTVAEAARQLGREVSFGSHLYQVPPADNAKISAVCPAFRRSSQETLGLFAAGMAR